MKPRAVYALSTGRCGTMTLAHLLNRSIYLWAQHEPAPTLENESLLGYKRDPSAYSIYVDARQEQVQKVNAAGLIYGETANRLSFFAYEIEKYFDGDVKYIHLVRDKQGYVRSRYARGAYTGNGPWEDANIQPVFKNPWDDQAWKDTPRQDKIAWAWEETNGWIMEFLSTVPHHRCYHLSFADLISRDVEPLKGIFDFIGVKPPKDKLMLDVIGKKLHAGDKERLGWYDQGRRW